MKSILPLKYEFSKSEISYNGWNGFLPLFFCCFFLFENATFNYCCSLQTRNLTAFNNACDKIVKRAVNFYCILNEFKPPINRNNKKRTKSKLRIKYNLLISEHCTNDANLNLNTISIFIFIR